ncbi:MAG: metal-dependent hydrolase [Caldisericia bacterium]|nr:metal-dependent hydrolase [Caldisericia bacterium]
MTPVGHSLTGLAIGISAVPAAFSTKKKVLPVLCFIVLANFPDIPIPYWGHDLYYFSHSVFMNFVLFLIIGILIRNIVQKIYPAVPVWRIFLFGWIAWFSHLLLDSFYNHGLGVMIWWPFFEQSLCLPIPWFSVLNAPILPITKESLRIWSIEFISYLPLVLIAVLLKRIMKRRGTFQGIIPGK